MIKHTDKNVNARRQCAKCMWGKQKWDLLTKMVEKNMKNVIGNRSFVRTKNSGVTTVKEMSDCE